MSLRITSTLALASLLTGTLLVTACSSFKDIETKPAEVNPTDMPKGPGLLSGKSGNLLDAFNKRGDGEGGGGGHIGVNTYLWRSALESLSFMPITQADSNGGVITTDWYSNPKKPDERVKATALILGKSLRADAIKVSLFKQVRGKSGQWGDAEVSPATSRALEDTILTKARVLKVQAQADAK